MIIKITETTRRLTEKSHVILKSQRSRTLLWVSSDLPLGQIHWLSHLVTGRFSFACRLSVMDENKVSSNAFIGETCVTLKTLNSRPVQRFKRLLSEQSDVSLQSRNVQHYFLIRTPYSSLRPVTLILFPFSKQ